MLHSHNADALARGEEGLTLSSEHISRYAMPAEYAGHAATWMSWPVRSDNWREAAEPAQTAFANVANAICAFEPVRMLVLPEALPSAKALLSPKVTLVTAQYNDSWLRDTGPTFVRNGLDDLMAVDWVFNGWGGLYTPYDDDDKVASVVAGHVGVPRYRSRMVMEGGAIHVDGEGTCLTTEECLLNPNRNPAMSRSEIERELKARLGVSKVIWLPFGVFMDDDTSGHIDNLACFVRPGEVALTWTDDTHDPQYARSTAALEVLLSVSDAQGRQLKVHKIHQPEPQLVSADEAAGLTGEFKHRGAGRRMAASYINFYIANGAVIMPAFGSKRDAAARAALAGLFPDRRIVQIASREILLGGGNIHCITQQQPA